MLRSTDTTCSRKTQVLYKHCRGEAASLHRGGQKHAQCLF